MCADTKYKQKTRCETCKKFYEWDDMAAHMVCRTCYNSRISLEMTKASKKRVNYVAIQREKKHVSRFIYSQVKRLRCTECGEKLFYGRDHFSLDLRLLQLNCTGNNQHSMYALIDLRGKVTALYKSGTWFQENYRFVHDDIPF